MVINIVIVLYSLVKREKKRKRKIELNCNIVFNLEYRNWEFFVILFVN